MIFMCTRKFFFMCLNLLIIFCCLPSSRLFNYLQLSFLVEALYKEKLSCLKEINVNFFSLLISASATNCVFPSQWNGSWFQSGEQQPITFSGSVMSSRGRCVASDGDKFLLVNE